MKKVRLATDGQMARLLELKARKKLPFDDVKALIDKHNPRKELADRSDPWFVFWETAYPGKGTGLARMLRPFRSRKPALRPAVIDLVSRARNVFGSSPNGVYIRYSSEETDIVRTIEIELWRRLQASCGESHGNSAMASALGHVRQVFVDQQDATVRELISRCVALVGEGESADWCERFLDFYLIGNPPIGFDIGGHLIFRAAPPT